MNDRYKFFVGVIGVGHVSKELSRYDLIGRNFEEVITDVLQTSGNQGMVERARRDMTSVLGYRVLFDISEEDYPAKLNIAKPSDPVSVHLNHFPGRSFRTLIVRNYTVF